MKSNEDEKRSRSLRFLLRPVIFLCVIIALFIASYVFGWTEQLSALQPWIQQQGIWAPVIFIIVYLAIVIAAIPATPLGVLAGALFGSLYGVILVSIASTLGAAIAFLIARYIAKDSVEQWMQHRKRLKRLYELTEKHGFLIVAITRLIPLFPYNLLNYGFGLTKVPFRTYLFWSWLCMLPGTIVIVVGSDAVLTMLATGIIRWDLLIILIGTALFLILLSWFVKKKMPPPTS